MFVNISGFKFIESLPKCGKMLFFFFPAMRKTKSSVSFHEIFLELITIVQTFLVTHFDVFDLCVGGWEVVVD